MTNQPSPERVEMSKAHLAELCNVSPATIRRWCNQLYYEELKSLGYYRTQRLFTPRQWHWILDRLVV